MLIDELAQKAGTTTRNIRSYQTLGLLPAPELVGRVGHYDDGHLARLRLIARLQDQGYSLAAIGGLIRAWEQGRSLGDVLGFEEALTAPFSDEAAEEISLEDLVKLFPEAVYDPGLAQRAVELDLVRPEGDHFVIPSPSLLRAGAALVETGVPIEVTQEEVARLHQDLDRIAARFAAMFDTYIWRPYVEAGMPADELPRVSEALRRLRPLAAVVVNAVLAQAMDRQTAASTAGQVTALAPLVDKEMTDDQDRA